MKRMTWIAWFPLLRAESNDGVISVKALIELGVSEMTAYRWCRQGGPCQLLLPGILVLHNGPPTRRQKEIGALLHGGEGAMLTGMSAGRHHGLRRGADPYAVHILIPHHRRVRCAKFVVVERTTRPPRPLERDGLAVAPLVRAVLDEARRIRDETTIAALLAEPVQRRLVLPQALSDELEAGCRRGTAAPRAVIKAILDGVRSAAEFDAREWWLAHPDLPRARFNVRVIDANGRLVAIVDVLVEEVGFAWEIDSVEHHFATAEQVAHTVARHRAVRSVGLHLVSTRPSEQRNDPEGTYRDVLDGLAVAERLPPPRASYQDDLPRS